MDYLAVYATLLAQSVCPREPLKLRSPEFIAAVVILLSAQVGNAASCEPRLAQANLAHRLVDTQSAGNQAVFGLHVQRCNGGLYLVDMQADATQADHSVWKINEMWWLDEAHSLVWFDGRKDQIAVVASFITGIGPTGTKPFTKQFVLALEQGNWTVTHTNDVSHPATSRQAERLNDTSH